MAHPHPHAAAHGVTKLAAIAALVLGALPGLAWSAPLLYNTGVDDAGNPIASNAVDSHYQITGSGVFGPNAYAKHDGDGYPIQAGVWLLDDGVSSWIVPSTNFFFGDQAGVTDRMTYRLRFDLTGYLPASGTVTGRWAVDDTGLDMRLNGVSVPGATGNNQPNYAAWSNFTISSGFIDGINTLEFDTESTLNPTGLRVEFTSVVFQPVPEPGTGAMLIAGLLAVGVWRVRQQARRS